MDNKNVKRYQPKSLSNYKANRIFGRYCKGDESVMDRARRIALKHSQQLVDYANAEADRIDAESDRRLAALEAKAAARKEQLEREKKYGKPLQSDVWYQNEPRKTGPMPLLISGLTQAEKEEARAEALALSKVERGVKAEAPTNEQLAAEMAAESYGASGGDQEELYQQNLARLNKEDAEFMADWNKTGEPKETRGPAPGSWAATARMMAQGDDSGFDWDRWKDEMKERDM